MYFTYILPLFSLPAALATLSPAQLFANPPTVSAHFPSIHESTVQARRILALSSIATLSSVFPSISSTEQRPASVAGASIGLTDYYALCGPAAYDPTLLAVTIATTFKNAAAGSNVTLSLRYHVPADAPPTDDPYAYSPANLPRFSLVGHIEPIGDAEVKKYNIDRCFLDAHNDSALWQPGTDIHESWWARLVVEEVYWFGGFGDRARIGWLPIEDWRGVTEKEVEEYRMIGEKDYEEWAQRQGRWVVEAEGHETLEL